VTIRDVLVRSRALIAKGWTQAAAARDANGRECAAFAAEAISWCAAGAICCCIRPGGASYNAVAAAMGFSSAIAAPDSLPVFNDRQTTTQQDVLDAFDRAIAKCEEPC
jgi:hypothetical protein